MQQIKQEIEINLIIVYSLSIFAISMMLQLRNFCSIIKNDNLRITKIIKY